MFRDNSDKLERHELRERQLGEHLKKALSTVEKKQKTEETHTDAILEVLNNISKRLETLEDVVAKVSIFCSYICYCCHHTNDTESIISYVFRLTMILQLYRQINSTKFCK